MRVAIWSLRLRPAPASEARLLFRFGVALGSLSVAHSLLQTTMGLFVSEVERAAEAIRLWRLLELHDDLVRSNALLSTAPAEFLEVLAAIPRRVPSVALCLGTSFSRSAKVIAIALSAWQNLHLFDDGQVLHLLNVKAIKLLP